MSDVLWLASGLVLFGLNVFYVLESFRDGRYGWCAFSVACAVAALLMLSRGDL